MDALILMTRIPYRGYTKTRLMPHVSAVDCEKLHKCFLSDYFSCFDDLSDNTDIFIAYAPEKFSRDFLNNLPPQYKTFPQEGVNLGSRMFKAFEKLFAKGYEKIVLIGCDIPHIQLRTYKDAFNNLEKNDMVISPTEDGGYCLIGLTRNHQSLFINDVSWGEQSVIESTLTTANELGLTVSILDKYRDLDEFKDLIALRDLFGRAAKKFDHIPMYTLDFLDELLEQKVV